MGLSVLRVMAKIPVLVLVFYSIMTLLELNNVDLLLPHQSLIQHLANSFLVGYKFNITYYAIYYFVVSNVFI